MLAAVGCVQLNNKQRRAGPACPHPNTECISPQGVADDLVLASTAKGELSALRAEDLSPVWTFPTGEEDPKIELEAIYGTSVVIGDTAYLGAYSGDVYALGLEDGSVRWRFEADAPIIAGLAASETAVYVASDDGTLYILDPQTGKQVEQVDPFHAGDSIWAAPLLEEGVLYVASVNGKLYALDAETLDPVWDAPFEADHGFLSDPVLAEGTILVGGIGRALHSVDAETGKEREGWPFKADNWFWGQPLVADGTVYAPSLDGRLYALSLETGEERWSFEAEEPEPLRSAAILADDTLVIVDRDGNVYGLDRGEEPEDERLLWSEALEKTVLSNPLVVKRGGAEGEEVEEVLISAQGGDLFSVNPTTGKSTEVEAP